MNDTISAAERASFYKVLYGRRDVRSAFLSDPIADDCLLRILQAAHHAPSVGLSQPWNFITVTRLDTRQQVFNAFCEANNEAQQLFTGDRKEKYASLKLQGILDAPMNVLVTCDRTRGGSIVLGKTHQPEMDKYSTVCAVQNLWLAARSENIGVGWVSIIRPESLVDIFGLPAHVVPIAYLCLGYVKHFDDQPELQIKGWEQRTSLKDLVFPERWPSMPSDKS